MIRIDEFIDQLLTSDYACDIALPRLPKRWHLEDAKMLPPRITFAEDDEVEDEVQGEGEVEVEEGEEVMVEEPKAMVKEKSVKEVRDKEERKEV